MRIASIRSGSTTASPRPAFPRVPRRSSPSSTARCAGPTRRSPKSMPSCPSSPSSKYQSSRRFRLPGSGTLVTFREFRFCGLSAFAEDARPSSRTPRRWNGWDDSSAAFIASARSRLLSSVRRSMSRPSARSRATGCSRTTSFRPISRTRGRASSRSRSRASCAALSARATVHYIRLHGDCHAGNVLWAESGPHFVDFDDARMGPAIQDLWMLLSGDRSDMRRQLRAIVRGYEDFHDFNDRELWLIEALRTLRLIHYSAWLARRWDDPAFPAAFPVVQHPALLAGPCPRIARTGGGDGRAGAAL